MNAVTESEVQSGGSETRFMPKAAMQIGLVVGIALVATACSSGGGSDSWWSANSPSGWFEPGSEDDLAGGTANTGESFPPPGGLRTASNEASYSDGIRGSGQGTIKASGSVAQEPRPDAAPTGQVTYDPNAPFRVPQANQPSMPDMQRARTLPQRPTAQARRLPTNPAAAMTANANGTIGSFDTPFEAVAGRQVYSGSAPAAPRSYPGYGPYMAPGAQGGMTAVAANQASASPYNYSRGMLQPTAGTTPPASAEYRPVTRPVVPATTVMNQRPSSPSTTGLRPSGVVNFAQGSVNLSQSDRADILAVAARARETGGKVKVIGYSAAPSQDQAAGKSGFSLALERANQVASVLVRAGLPASRVHVEARGNAGARNAELFLL